MAEYTVYTRGGRRVVVNAAAPREALARVPGAAAALWLERAEHRMMTVVARDGDGREARVTATRLQQWWRVQADRNGVAPRRVRGDMVRALLAAEQMALAALQKGGGA